MGAISGLSSPPDVGVSIPQTLTLEISQANVEQTYSFPANAKQFKIFNDGRYLAKLSYQETESATEFYPLYPGAEYSVYGITAPSVTIYIQSPGIITLRLEIWQ